MDLGIKDLEWNLLLKFCGYIHKYVNDNMELMDISLLDATYQYAMKIKKKLK